MACNNASISLRYSAFETRLEREGGGSAKYTPMDVFLPLCVIFLESPKYRTRVHYSCFVWQKNTAGCIAIRTDSSISSQG